MQVRERITLLGVIYYEYCHRSASHEYPLFHYWSEATIQQIKKDFFENVSDNFTKVRESLIAYFGSEEDVTNELWLNCYEGKNNLILKNNIKEQILSEPNYNRESAEDWFKQSLTFSDINDYHGMSI